MKVQLMIHGIVEIHKPVQSKIYRNSITQTVSLKQVRQHNSKDGERKTINTIIEAKRFNNNILLEGDKGDKVYVELELVNVYGENTFLVQRWAKVEESTFNPNISPKDKLKSV